MNFALSISAAFLLGFAAAGLATGLHAQSSASTARAVQETIPNLTAEISPSSVILNIDDPSSGARWLLVRNTSHPGGPGRLVLVAAPKQETGAPLQLPPPDPLTPVIRAGERTTLEMHTSTADAWLEAIALSPARLGSPLRVRLNVGGRIVRAIAAGPGRATLAPETEGWSR